MDHNQTILPCRAFLCPVAPESAGLRRARGVLGLADGEFATEQTANHKKGEHRGATDRFILKFVKIPESAKARQPR